MGGWGRAVEVAPFEISTSTKLYPFVGSYIYQRIEAPLPPTGQASASGEAAVAAGDDEEFLTPPSTPQLSGSCPGGAGAPAAPEPSPSPPASEVTAVTALEQSPLPSEAVPTPSPSPSPAEAVPTLSPSPSPAEAERRLLLSMGWVDDDEEGGGLEEWEIHAAQESVTRRQQQDPTNS